MNRLVRIGIWVAILFAILVAWTVVARGECGVVVGSAATALPRFSGTLPPGGAMVLGDGYLYVLTQWGFARASLANPANPGPYSLSNIGGYHGNGGRIPILCDCHQGDNTMAVATSPTGARMICDWQPYSQGGPPGAAHFSGLGAQLVTATGGVMSFGNQVNLGTGTSSAVPLGTSLAAIWTGSKYFGYWPTQEQGVLFADVSSPTGSSSYLNAIVATPAIGWSAVDNSTFPPSVRGVRLGAGHVAVTGYDKYLLVGATADRTLHVAEINPTTGIPVETASLAFGIIPYNLEVAVLSGRIFIFASESKALHAYEYVHATHQLVVGPTIPGIFDRVLVRGGVIFAHRQVLWNESYIDIYDPAWATAGSPPVIVKSIRNIGAPPPNSGQGRAFEALVVGSTVYVYRSIQTTPESSIHTDKVDISCLTGGLPPPTVTAGGPTSTPTTIPTKTKTPAPTVVVPTKTKTPNTGPCIPGAPWTCPKTPTRTPTRTVVPPTATSTSTPVPHTPVPTLTKTVVATATPSVQPTATRTVVALPPPKPTPPASNSGCGGKGGVVIGTLVAGLAILVAKLRLL